MRLGGNRGEGDQLEAEYGSSEVLICNFHFARNGDFFFQKALDFLEFRPFTNIFLGQKEEKTPTKCPSQLLTSTVNHGHKTTAMWLTKSYVFSHLVIGNHLAIFTMSSADRQTDAQTHPLSPKSPVVQPRSSDDFAFHPFSLSNPFLKLPSKA